MKQLFTTLMVLCCPSFTFAQGLQGNITVSGSVITVTGHSATLTWTASPNVTSYNLYRGTVSGGPYMRMASGITVLTYTDVRVNHGQTLYYVATAVNGNGESAYSNETTAVIP
jgi:fibronectin type 3 domain-containing protein